MGLSVFNLFSFTKICYSNIAYFNNCYVCSFAPFQADPLHVLSRIDSSSYVIGLMGTK